MPDPTPQEDIQPIIPQATPIVESAGFIDIPFDPIRKIDRLWVGTLYGPTNQSRAKAYLATANQSIPATTWTKITLNAESYDSQNEFDSTTNNRFTATVAGYYSVICGVFYPAPGADNRFYVSVYKNGSNISNKIYHTSAAGEAGGLNGDILYLAANDYVELWTYHYGAGALDVGTGEGNTYLTIHKLS